MSPVAADVNLTIHQAAGLFALNRLAALADLESQQQTALGNQDVAKILKSCSEHLVKKATQHLRQCQTGVVLANGALPGTYKTP